MTIHDLLEHHKQAKREIIARFQQLAEVADSVGMVTLARDIRTTRIPKLESERFHLVVLGEFNHGKSTFVNALLGSDVAADRDHADHRVDQPRRVRADTRPRASC